MGVAMWRLVSWFMSWLSLIINAILFAEGISQSSSPSAPPASATPPPTRVVHAVTDLIMSRVGRSAVDVESRTSHLNLTFTKPTPVGHPNNLKPVVGTGRLTAKPSSHSEDINYSTIRYGPPEPDSPSYDPYPPGHPLSSGPSSGPSSGSSSGPPPGHHQSSGPPPPKSESAPSFPPTSMQDITFPPGFAFPPYYPMPQHPPYPSDRTYVPLLGQIDPFLIIAIVAIPVLTSLGFTSLVMPLIPIFIYLINMFFGPGGSGRKRRSLGGHPLASVRARLDHYLTILEKALEEVSHDRR
ncbi:hypothetical protein HDE_00829 [Halotydeus destructor]|nr:hypothetical protein HDE_00829 [Halotydeus destructor]